MYRVGVLCVHRREHEAARGERGSLFWSLVHRKMGKSEGRVDPKVGKEGQGRWGPVLVKVLIARMSRVDRWSRVLLVDGLRCC